MPDSFLSDDEVDEIVEAPHAPQAVPVAALPVELVRQRAHHDLHLDVEPRHEPPAVNTPRRGRAQDFIVPASTLGPQTITSSPQNSGEMYTKLQVERLHHAVQHGHDWEVEAILKVCPEAAGAPPACLLACLPACLPSNSPTRPRPACAAADVRRPLARLEHP